MARQRQTELRSQAAECQRAPRRIIPRWHLSWSRANLSGDQPSVIIIISMTRMVWPGHDAEPLQHYGQLAAGSATSLPANAADQATRQAETAARLGKQLAGSTPPHALISELETAADPQDPAGQAHHARIRASYAERYDEHTRTETALAAADTIATQRDNPTLLDERPLDGSWGPQHPIAGTAEWGMRPPKPCTVRYVHLCDKLMFRHFGC
jgi:hypothetical protein